MRLAKAHRTIGPRIRINRHDGASARCSDSNRSDQPNDSCLFTPPSTTHSTSSAISHLAARSAFSETKRSRRGEPPPRPEPELGLQRFTRTNSVCVTRPACDLDAAATGDQVERRPAAGRDLVRRGPLRAEPAQAFELRPHAQQGGEAAEHIGHFERGHLCWRSLPQSRSARPSA